jgi:DNA-binding beta-propeller fold protein YncE
MDFLRRAVLATIACSWLFLSGCGNTFRPIATPLTLAPGNPQLADMVAVYNVNPCTTAFVLVNSVKQCNSDATGSLTVFSVAGDTNVGNYAIGANDQLTIASPLVNPLTSRLITFAGGDTFVATADPESDTVTLYNTLEGTTTAISLPQDLYPTFITATATTGLILVSLQEVSPASSNPTCPGGKGAIGIIPTGTAALANTVCAGSKPGFLLVAQSDSEVFILDQTDHNVSVLNLSTLSPSSTMSAVIPVGMNPIWATTSLDGNTIYVLNHGSNDISVIDAVGQSIIAGSVKPRKPGTTLALSSLSAPSVIITDRNMNRLYISNTGMVPSNSANNTVSVLDATSLDTTPATIATLGSPTLTELHAPIAVGANPIALAVTLDGSSVYVADTWANTASVINGNSFNVSVLTPDTTNAAALVQSVAVSNDGTKAFIAVTVPGDRAIANSNNPDLPASGNGIYVVLTSNNSFATNDTGGVLNIAPPQDMSCDVTETCFVPGAGSVLLQRPLQIVPRI